MTVAASTLLDEVLDAHGGADRWLAASTVRARVRSGGLLVRTRAAGNKFADYRLTVELEEPRAVAEPYPTEGHRGVYERGEVRIETAEGETVSSRRDARSQFFGRAGLRRNLRWDELDSMYFAGYAMWNYVCTPRLLLRDGMKVREGEPWTHDGDTWRRLEVTFPEGIDTHSRDQVFYFAANGLQRRLDYVAYVIGRWAHGAHHTADHVEADGLVFPTRRWVRPIGPGNRSMPFPTMVSLSLSEIEVE